MLDILTVSNHYPDRPNVLVLTDSLLAELNLANNTKLSIVKHDNGVIELVPVSEHSKGDIRRLKGLVKTNITASIDEMNDGITMGAIHGE